MRRLEGLRFLFVTGKGGVGKSTIAAALGLRAARLGQKTLVVAATGTNQLGRLFQLPVSTRPERVEKNLFVATIDPEEAMKEYVEATLGSRLLADALFHPKFSRGFLHGIPGLAPWALLGKAWYYSQTGRAGPALPEAPFDCVVFDAPSTGDGTDLLRLPRVIGDLTPLGRFKKDAEDCWATLQNPDESALVPVTLPADLPVTETLELLSLVRRDLGLPLGPLVVNQTSERFFDADLAEKISKISMESLPEDERSIWRAAERRLLREREESAQLARVEELGLPTVFIPHFIPPPRGLPGLAEIARCFQDPGA